MYKVGLGMGYLELPQGKLLAYKTTAFRHRPTELMTTILCDRVAN